MIEIMTNYMDATVYTSVAYLNNKCLQISYFVCIIILNENLLNSFLFFQYLFFCL